jgi:hypothetical protein
VACPRDRERDEVAVVAEVDVEVEVDVDDEREDDATLLGTHLAGSALASPAQSPGRRSG